MNKESAEKFLEYAKKNTAPAMRDKKMTFREAIKIASDFLIASDWDNIDDVIKFAPFIESTDYDAKGAADLRFKYIAIEEGGEEFSLPSGP